MYRDLYVYIYIYVFVHRVCIYIYIHISQDVGRLGGGLSHIYIYIYSRMLGGWDED